MDYILQFHCWYILIAIFIVFLMTGKKKGGIVSTKLIADLTILDPRFEGCKTEAEYSIFKNGSADHIEIEVERLSLPVGDELELFLNGKSLAIIKVERDKEAEFDHWADEGVDFPVVKDGDELLVKYHDELIMEGIFRSVGV